MKPNSRKPEAGDLRERALALLARREHTRAELARKLAAGGFAAEDVRPLLDEFEARTWLSDRRFAESWVADHRDRSGAIKLAFELRQHGVPEALIDDVLADQRDNEAARARSVWEKKFGVPPANPADRAKQMRFLQGRGFALDVIQHILRGRGED
ncbi:MAG: recombination regulator RecX [Thiobacillus sp. 65-29]|jgi:regulatory protein|nr:MAG: recombination regulator RecX [Thiobacillus sp. 65-29]